MKPTGLRYKINIIIVATAVIIALVFGVILYPFEAGQYKEELREIKFLLTTISKQKNEDLSNELFARQVRALEASIKEILSIEGVAGVTVYMPEGIPFMTSDIRFSKVLGEEERNILTGGALFTALSEEGNYFAVYSSKMEVIGKTIGYLRIYYDLANVRRQRSLAVMISVFLLLSTIAVMAALLNVLLTRFVIRPVTVLQKAMHKVEDGLLGETVSIPFDDEMGEMGRAFNTMSLKLKEGQEAIRYAEEKYRGIFENAIEGIFQYAGSPADCFVTANLSAARMLGYSTPKDFISSVGDWKEELFVDSREVSELIVRLQEEGSVVAFETRFRRRNGDAIWVSLSVQKIDNQAVNPIYYEGSFIDITERKEKEAAERERKAAEASNRAKSQFLAHMSHEIRTPMNAVLGFTDLLMASIADPQHRQYLEAIESSGRGLLALINDMLDLSKIEAGKMEINYKPSSLRFVIQEIERIFSLPSREKGIDFIVDIAPNLPACLMIDEIKIRQILFNLVGNAVKFTDKGRIRLSASPQGTALDDSIDLVIAVEDTGIGIPEEDRKNIFDAFRQQGGQSAGQYGGTGLGLTISKNIAEMMGGSLALSSSARGSIFTLLLPGVAIAAPELAGEIRIDRNERTFALGVATVLVADDLEINRNLIKEFLKDQPVSVIEVDSGYDAVKQAENTMPDVILMDIRMPGMDGYEALVKLKFDERTRNIPIIAVTAAGMKDEREHVALGGFDDCLIRPVSRRDLLASLSRFIGAGGTDDAVRLPQQDEPVNIEMQSEELRKKIPHLLVLLEPEVEDWWELANRRRRMRDIEEFARRVRDIGDSQAVALLHDYGAKLLFYAAGFDIDNIRSMLDYYPRLINALKGMIKDNA
ncbi:MAG: response regulator [Deltaproteobacteria bacterium]|nr:response regulator [Deltaproteobacteria bacterium]